MNEPDPKLSLKLRKLLFNLPKIEEDVRERFDCEELFEDIELRKRSIRFALFAKDEVKALYEACSLEEFYVDLLTG